MSNKQFSQTRMKKVLKSETSKQISSEAADELGEELEQKAEEVSKEARNIAAQNGRKTVQKEDVREALSQVNL